MPGEVRTAIAAAAVCGTRMTALLGPMRLSVRVVDVALAVRVTEPVAFSFPASTRFKTRAMRVSQLAHSDCSTVSGTGPMPIAGMLALIAQTGLPASSSPARLAGA